MVKDSRAPVETSNFARRPSRPGLEATEKGLLPA